MFIRKKLLEYLLYGYIYGMYIVEFLIYKGVKYIYVYYNKI